MKGPSTISYSAALTDKGVWVEVIYDGGIHREDMTRERFVQFRKRLDTTLTVGILSIPMSRFKIRVRRSMKEYFASL